MHNLTLIILQGFIHIRLAAAGRKFENSVMEIAQNPNEANSILYTFKNFSKF